MKIPEIRIILLSSRISGLLQQDSINKPDLVLS